MDWFGAEISGPLVAVRAVHFAATAITAGSLVFRAVAAKPARRSEETVEKLLRKQTLRVASIGLVIAVLSGVVWFLLQAASMSGLPLDEASTARVLSTVLNRTQFGLVAEIRIILAISVAACLAYYRFALAEWLAPVAALGLAAAIAWTGHAGSTPGDTGLLHLAADALHLLGASAWIGGLVSLVLVLAAVRHRQSVASASRAWDTTRRFSTLGVVSVAILAATGIVNAWILVGSFHALVATGYGRLLMLKLVAIATMLVFAFVNRFWLTPQLAASSGELRLETLRQLTRNSSIEIALALAIFAIVGVLGTLHPAVHLL
jgi:copper resistance protein D